jgi:hypothetical protein
MYVRVLSCAYDSKMSHHDSIGGSYEPDLWHVKRVYAHKNKVHLV